MFSPHATMRMQQRGFQQHHVELIIDYGREQILSGANVFTVTRKIAKKMRNDGVPLVDTERCKSCYVVVVRGTIATVAHIH